MAKYKTLETWLSEMLHETIVDGEKSRKLTAIGCFWVKPGTTSEEVLTIQLTGKSWTVESLFNTFRGKAEHKVQDIGGRHHFEMRAYFDGQGAPGEHHTFVIEDGELKSNGAQRRQAEDATKDGLFAQMMRHLDNKDATLLSFATMVQQTSLAREQQLWSRINDLTSEVNDGYTLMREILFGKSVAEHQMEMQRLGFVRETERQKLMIGMAPSLLNAATGTDAVPDANSDGMMIDKLAERLDEQKLKMAVMAGLVTEEEAGFIRLRAAKVVERKAKEKEAQARVPAGASGDAKSNVTPINRQISGGKKDGGNEGGAAPASV